MIHTGDCIEVMRDMDADSVDAVVTDPPYAIGFMGKRWDGPAAFVERKAGGATFDHVGGNHHPTSQADVARTRLSEGTKFQAWCTEWGTEALRVTKPGGYLLAFGGTRTHHRLVCGLEDAGWIIRDELTWVYASGFPKGKANLKPAHEPIVLARKPGPLRPLGIDAGRIPGPPWSKQNGAAGAGFLTGKFAGSMGNGEPTQQFSLKESEGGRWPSNLLLSDPELFDEPNPYVVGSGATVASSAPYVRATDVRVEGWGMVKGAGMEQGGYGDSGGYSRFFLVPKSSRADREPVVRGQLPEQELQTHGAREQGTLPQQTPQGPIRRVNVHPTCKPTDLMRHLIRLVTPPGGVVLDPFLGSGTTAKAATLEGFEWIGIEKEPEYVAIAEARLNGTQRGLGLDVPAPTRKPPSTHPDLSKHQPKHGHSGPGSWFVPHDGEEPAA